ncbi:hypothetical protein FNF27_00219 [Cafeteria roenbergensis]|uniref:Importin subunit alpha n=1 Tax=Cafeteria roenbergensis TaxID=33653 RepID=A0A5A8CVQ4_CAFRO|nr:hypothetical protein FNF29_01350 [Cafeteria roenbergensis]KAA0178369.1 hypothetical protein FNF27_00219 [Cafeteria roenbergensis]|eukprot:KAA0155931.1 hypothetical protein FNF29_01350 [Cafeteria roenbergensis]
MADLSGRLTGFHKGIDSSVARRSREDAAVQLRKARVVERMNKRRAAAVDPAAAGTAEAAASAAEDATFTSGMLTPRAGMSATEQHTVVTQCVAGLRSGDDRHALAGVVNLRRLLSIEVHPPIDMVISAGAMSFLIAMLKRVDHPKLQFEATWCLTNIASGTAAHTELVITSGAPELLVQMLGSREVNVREQAVWALGNIAGDSPKTRDFVMSIGGMLPILNLLRPELSPSQSMLRNVAWCISNFCRGKPRPHLDTLQPCLASLTYIIGSMSDTEVLTDACWALSYLSDGGNERVQAVLERGLLPRIIELLSHPKTSVRTPALRCIGNVITGDDDQTEAAVAAGCLPKLLHLVEDMTRPSICKEAMWAISNIAAGTPEQVGQLITKGFFPVVIEACATARAEVRKEAAWTISNAVTGGTADQLRQLIAQGIVSAIGSLLAYADTRVAKIALETLENLLRRVSELDTTGESDAALRDVIDEAGIVEMLADLGNSGDETIHNRCMRILTDFFPDELEDEDDDEFPGAAGMPYGAPGGYGGPHGPGGPGAGGNPFGSAGAGAANPFASMGHKGFGSS